MGKILIIIMKYTDYKYSVLDMIIWPAVTPYPTRFLSLVCFCVAYSLLVLSVLGHDDDVEGLLEEGADVNRRHGTLLPLHCACMVGNPEVVQLLIEKEAHVSLGPISLGLSFKS